MTRSPKIELSSDGATCRRCGQTFADLVACLGHIATTHVKAKPKRHNKPRDPVRHPNAAERRDIRAAIREAKQRKLPHV